MIVDILIMVGYIILFLILVVILIWIGYKLFISKLFWIITAPIWIVGFFVCPILDIVAFLIVYVIWEGFRAAENNDTDTVKE